AEMNDTRTSRTGATAGQAAGGPRKRNRLSADDKLKELKRRLLEINDLSAAGSVLSWDHATYMPQGGASARSRQGATLRRLAHERFVDPAMGRLIDGLTAYAESLPAENDDASLIRVVRRDFEKAIKVPSAFVQRFNALGSASYDVWTRARPANDFAAVLPFLEQLLDLSREYADFFAPYEHAADPLIDDADEGMTAASVCALFSDLRPELVALVRAIGDQPAIEDQCLRGAFAPNAQLDFGLAVAQRMGYDVERGRLDQTHHPFCTKFSLGDVRITTWIDEGDIGKALFATVHEAGHALYEQGVDAALEGTPLGSGTSAGVHESQSRLWENVVARSRGFWEHDYPVLQRTFPHPFERVPLDTFYRAINKVERSLIRTDADEVTYNLHIMLRFDLELELLEGRLRVKDLPEAWRARMQADLGVAPPDDRDGCLQDVHWYSGGIGGGFQSYTIGNVLSAQIYAAAITTHPDIPRDIAAGHFATLHAWLREHIYRHGRKYTPADLIARTTGAPMSTGPYLAYLRQKYGEIYNLPAMSAAG
ncbi:MAG: carboxypeptidase M32, partial [Xanthobacteraceae bacterium]